MAEKEQKYEISVADTTSEAKKPTLAELFDSRDCFVTTLTLACLAKLGYECLDWEPEVVAEAFCHEFGLNKLSQRNYDKLQAGLMLVGTNAFVSTLEGFLAATKVMNNRLFDETEAPFCDIQMCSWSVCEYSQLIGANDDGRPEETFSPDIVVYIQEAGKLNGMTKFPVWLDFADSELNMPDLSGDTDLFEMYSQRQQTYIEILEAQAAEKQRRLAEQLLMLKDAGIVAKTDEKATKTA